MTHLLLWLLLYPLVAAADLYARSQVAEVDPGKHARGSLATYCIGAFILLTVMYV